MENSQHAHLETATFAGGCFWCTETAFNRLRGVERAVSGYTGGDVPNPSYRAVCTGNTGHAEAVQITFNPEHISYRTLLEVFFSLHDPTTLNRQGNDVGTQYRSAIFYHDQAQHEAAEAIVKELNDSRAFGQPLVTEVVPATRFYPAEDEHQRYFEKAPYTPYCQVVVAPKVAKFRQHYASLLKDWPAHSGPQPV